MYKIEKLYHHQRELIAADKARKENRQGVQTVCRMVGSLTQSYFVLDNQQFKIARQLYFGIDEVEDGEEDQKIEGLDKKNSLGTISEDSDEDDETLSEEDEHDIQQSINEESKH